MISMVAIKIYTILVYRSIDGKYTIYVARVRNGVKNKL